MMRRMFVAVGLVMLAEPGIQAWAHTWTWAWSAGAGILAGFVAGAITRDRKRV